MDCFVLFMFLRNRNRTIPLCVICSAEFFNLPAGRQTSSTELGLKFGVGMKQFIPTASGGY